MKGDFTRLTHDSAKRYAKVRKQQGRADVDADFNEQVDIQAHLDATRTRDIVGVTGFPKGPAFTFAALANGTVQIEPGRAYVDGILAELPGTAPVDYLTQPDLPSPPPINPTANRRDLVYLDVWERHITAHQDPSIKEVALGGADTATRVQVVSQVRILQNVGPGVNCDTADWAPSPSGGRLTTELDTPAIPPDPCSPLPGSSFRGLENRLYRVEVHTPGNVNVATWKWSRDNGAVTFGIKQFRPNEAKRVELVRMGRDAVLSVKNGDWAEVLGDRTELQNVGGTLTKVDGVDAPSRIVTFENDVDSHKTEAHPVVRRWDGPPQTTSGNAIELEDGINVRFSGSNFKVGDHWMFTARTAAEGGLEILTDAEPHGIRHHYAKLGFIEWKQVNNVFAPVVTDCRDLFPPLNDIDAEDVGFDSDVCEFGPEVKTVKDALEALCSADHDCCTLVAKPGPGWESVFDEIPAQGNAAICFKSGDFPVSSTGPIVVSNKGHLKLTGVGPGTRILATAAETAIRFVNCKSVTVRDLHVKTSVSGSGGATEHLGGALTFRNVGKVSLSSLDVECPNATRRRAACLTIHNDPPSTVDKGIVEVENCELRIGDEQVGLLVINTNRATIRNNRMRVLAATGGFNGKLQDFNSRSGLVRALISDVTFRVPPKLAEIKGPVDGLTRGAGDTATEIDNPEPRKKLLKRGLPGRETNVKIVVREKELRFRTDSLLVKEWEKLLRANPPETDDEKEVTRQVRKIAEDLVMGKRKVTGPLDDFITGLQQEEASSASQGITVAGTVIEEVNITGNTLSGVSQGIHVGVSHHDLTQSDADHARRVVVTGNHIHVHAVVGATRSRHAIFVGNADSIVVRDNYAKLTRFTGTTDLPIDGIRLFGYFGRYLNVRENHVDRFGIGILVNLRGDAPSKKPMWQVHDNFTANATQAVVKNHEFIDVKGNLS
jgi:hypothetical protein